MPKNTSPVVIRYADENDAAAILTFLKELARYIIFFIFVHQFCIIFYIIF